MHAREMEGEQENGNASFGLKPWQKNQSKRKRNRNRNQQQHMEEPKKMKVRRVEEDVYDVLGKQLWTTILSLLPMDEAVRTSLVSRSWRYAWTTILHLDLNIFNTTKRCIEESERYFWTPWDGDTDEWVRTLDHILQSHTGPIQSCYLPTFYCEDMSSVDRWIKILMDRSIQDLVIESCDDCVYELPQCLFDCKTIKRLKLVHCRLSLPQSSFGCKNLKSLVLEETYIGPGTIQRLLSQCMLDSLTLEKCDFDEWPLNIHAPHLKHLSIDCLRDPELKLCIDAPHLNQLTLSNWVWLNDVQVRAPELEKFCCDIQEPYASLWRKKYEDLRVERDLIRALLRSLSHVKVLHLSGFTTKCLNGCVDFPPFANLKKLIVHVDFSATKGVPFFSMLLSCCPGLEELVIRSQFDFDPAKNGANKKGELFDSDYWEKQQQLLSFLHFNLKKVVIENYKGEEENFNHLACFLLRRAKGLEYIEIAGPPNPSFRKMVYEDPGIALKRHKSLLKDDIEHDIFFLST